MHPEICAIGPFTIYSYGLMLVAAFFTASFLCARQARKEGFDPELIFNLLFNVFIFGIIGCRVFYVFYQFDYYLQNPLEIIMLQKGGMAWFGGVVFGSAAAVVFIKKHKMRPGPVLDLVAPFIALGQAIGRIGCLLNGCCYGRETHLGLYFPVLEKTLVPTQLYSSLLLLLIFFILRRKQDSRHLPGEIVAGYFFLYSIKRFFIEFLRNDSPKSFYGLTIFQVLCIFMFLFSLGMFYRIYKGARKSASSK